MKRTFDSADKLKQAIDAVEILDLDYTVNRKTLEVKSLLFGSPQYFTIWTLEIKDGEIE